MEAYSVFRDLAIIIVAAKIFAILARKCKAPQVVGEIVAGLILGPSVLGLVQQSNFILQMAEIGVILLMFSAGLGTNLRELMKTGPIALLIALCGVGVVLTATSVSITVESLKEMGKLKGKVGTTILSAAIIDDVIGIIVLTFVIGFKNPESNPGTVIMDTVLFFLFAIGVGFVCYIAFKWMDKRYPHTRRIPILGLALCFAMAYIAERYFGIADITGAYVAGLILCSIQDSDYIARKMDINSYMIFGPIFFVSIGLKTNIGEMNMSILLFAVCFVLVGLITKIVGCGIMAKVCRFSNADSLKIGVGMMTRGEVALIVAQKGLNVGLLNSVYFTAVILLIVFSSILTPIILKILYSKDKMPKEPDSALAS